MKNLFWLNVCGVAIALVSLTLTPMPLIAQVKSGPAITNDNDRQMVDSLVRSTIVAFNQANLTGNFSVLRDLGSLEFQRVNTDQELATQFSQFRALNLDIGAVTLYEPVFTKKPVIDQNGYMQLQGYFPTEGIRIEFDLIFSLSEGRWRIQQISVNATSIPSSVAPRPASSSPKPTSKGEILQRKLN